jgi:hypothetical protein
VHRPRVHGQGHAGGAALVDHGGQGGLEDALGLLAHLLDDVVDVEEVAARGVELHVGLVEARDVGRVARLDGRGQLGLELLVGHHRVLDLGLLDAGRLGELEDLLLLQLVGQRGEVGHVPEDELLGALGVAAVDQPPGRGRRRGRHARRLEEPPPTRSCGHVALSLEMCCRGSLQPFTAPSVRPLTTQRWKIR